MEQIKNRLILLVDPTYRKFNANIVPSPREMLGVRMPDLRAVAREVSSGDFRAFLSTSVVCNNTVYEEVMVRGLVVGMAKWRDFDEQMIAVREFVLLIDNWAVCDCFCSSLKSTARNTARMLPFLDECLASGEEFKVRFGVVMLMSYYLNDSYIDAVLERLAPLDCSDYYIMMGVAWALSVAYVKFPDRTHRLLADRVFDEKTHRMAIRKITESYRVSPEAKASVLALR